MQVSVPPYTVSCTSCTSSVAGGLHWSRDGCTFRGRVAALTVLTELSFTPTPTTSPLAPHTACGRVWFGDSRMCLPKVGVSAYFWPFLFVLSVCVCVCVWVCVSVCVSVFVSAPTYPLDQAVVFPNGVRGSVLVSYFQSFR